MHAVIGVAELKQELEQIISKIESLVQAIGHELETPAKLNAALITMKLSEITSLSHKFLMFLAKIAQARNLFVQAHGELNHSQMHEWSEMTTRVFQIRTWMVDWTKVEGVVRKQILAKRYKLYRRATHTEAITPIQLSISDAIFDDVHQMLSQHAQNDEAREHGCFPDISLPQSIFIEHVHAAHRVLLAKRLKHPTRFLDVGCGGGLKVLSAARFFSRADGLEYDPGYVATAQRLFDMSGAGTCRVIHADGLTFEDYSQYDVIYFYRPMRDYDVLHQLEDQIVNTALPGTLIIAPYLMFDHRFKELGCGRIDNRLYITKTSQSDADALRRLAEKTGVSVTKQTQPFHGLWEPILGISRARGFAFDNYFEGLSTNN